MESPILNGTFLPFAHHQEPFAQNQNRKTENILHLFMAWILRSLFVSTTIIQFAAATQAQNGSPNIYAGGANDGFIMSASANQNPLPSIYTGGNNDGFNVNSAFSQNALPSIFSGGNNDGFNLSTSLSQNALPGIYSGGVNDGFHMLFTALQNTLPGIYSGGSNDGFNMRFVALQNTLPNIFLGGSNDGFDMQLAAGQNLLPGIYSGGANDGFSMYFKPSVVYVFIGAGNWNVASNWEDGLIPPSPLPAGYEIIINGTGTCILNVPQVIAPGARPTVMSGKLLQVTSIQ
jgi:hypothetical protein